MRTDSTKTLLATLAALAAVSALLAASAVHAQSGGSLADRRNAINTGKNPGIVVLGGSKAAPPATAASATTQAATASSGAGAVAPGAAATGQPVPAATGATAAATPAGARTGAAPAPAATAPAQDAPLLDRIVDTLKVGSPPSGQPISSARRLTSPTLGITLPTAAKAASQPAAKADPKP